MARVITHIVPYFAPTLDGVGDYARLLARQLRAMRGWQSRFIVADPTWNGPAAIEDFPAVKLANRNAAALADALRESETILLHYVGYGYQRRGVPVWLARGILREPRRIVTVFHEIWSKGSPRRSVFYLAWLQKLLVRKLLDASRGAFASTVTNVANLEQLRPGVTHWLPIPSNLPAPPQPLWRARPDPDWTPIVFGQTSPRSRTLTNHRRLIAGLHQRGLLKEILVAGRDAAAFPNPSEDIAALAGIIPTEKIRVLGEIGDASVFAQADVYLSSHRGRDACKSGALMAALSAGCPAILGDRSNSAPLREDAEILVCDGSPEAIHSIIAKKSAGQLGKVAANGREWFLRNADWPIISATIAQALEAA